MQPEEEIGGVDNLMMVWQKQAKDIHTIAECLLQDKKDREVFEKQVIEKMDHVADVLAKSAKEVVIKALRDVIRDFNQNLTEQFGENFKELNQAVFRLVQWQEKYRQQLAQMQAQYEQSVRAIELTQQAVDGIAGSAAAIPAHMAKLSVVISDNQSKLDELTGHLGAFARIRQEAVAALPEIQAHIGLVLDNMQNGSKQIEEVMSATAKTFEENTSGSLKEIEEVMSATAKTFEENTSGSLKEIEEVMSATAKAFEENTSGSLKEIEEAMSATIKAFEENTSGSLKELEEMGKIIANRAREIDEILSEAAGNIRQGVQIWLNDFEQALKQFQKRFEENLLQMTDEKREFYRRQLADIQALYEKMKEEIRQLLLDTQENMHKRQEETIGLLAKSLLTVTGKFAEEYQRLVDNMGRLGNSMGRFDR